MITSHEVTLLTLKMDGDRIGVERLAPSRRETCTDYAPFSAYKCNAISIKSRVRTSSEVRSSADLRMDLDLGLPSAIFDIAVTLRKSLLRLERGQYGL